MDELDPARVLIVEAIETLEVAIEQLMPAQAPTSTERQIRSGVQTIEYTSNSLTDFAKRVQSALPEVEGS